MLSPDNLAILTFGLALGFVAAHEFGDRVVTALLLGCLTGAAMSLVSKKFLVPAVIHDGSWFDSTATNFGLCGLGIALSIAIYVIAVLVINSRRAP